MANELTTSAGSLDDIVNAKITVPYIINALSERAGLFRLCRVFNAESLPTGAIQVPQMATYWGAPADHGTGTSTAFDQTQGTAIGNTGISTTNAAITATEYGVAHQVIDNVGEDSAIDSGSLLSFLTTTMLKVLNLAMDFDYIALYSGLSNNVGTTNTALSLANLLAAQQGIRVRGTDADQLAFVLDNIQVRDIENVLVATSTSAASYALSADRLINYAPSANNGMQTRQVMTFRGYPVYASGLTSTANTGADSVGACVCPATQYNDESGATTHGMVWKRLPRLEMQRQAKARGNDVVMTARAGFAKLQDGSGTSITTKVS